jgi:hypothetical protein
MAKARVTFRFKRIAEDDWRIFAEFPGKDTVEIHGFKSKADVDSWLDGTRKLDWLRSNGYAK